MIIVVADTSVYVSALVFGGIPQAAVEKALKRPYRLAMSDELRDELAETLIRKFGWPEERISAIADVLWTEALWRQPVAVQAARDPEDNHVLGCALAANAEIIVTGDKDLLALHPFQTIAIVTPAQFLTMRVDTREDGNDDDIF